MAKHTQTVRRQIADELFECVWPFCGVGGSSVKVYLIHNFVLLNKLKWSLRFQLLDISRLRVPVFLEVDHDFFLKLSMMLGAYVRLRVTARDFFNCVIKFDCNWCKIKVLIVLWLSTKTTCLGKFWFRCYWPKYSCLSRF